MRRTTFSFIFGFTLLVATSRIARAGDFPAADLRGFGEVSGSQTDSTIDGQAGSVLTINCEDADHARLVLAKYLSDAQTLPGVSRQSVKIDQRGMGSPVDAFQIEDHGWLSAVRIGNKVLIAASPTPETLAKQLGAALAGTHEPPVSRAEVKVPMWLDRWDQHGFRFYYWPWVTPPGVDVDAYDFHGDTTFARDHNVGLVFWDNLNHLFGADGQTDRPNWDWAPKWAAQDHVATAINLSALNYDIPPWLGNRFRDWMMLPMPDYLGDSMSVAGYRGASGKTGELAYGDTPALDAELRALQQDVRHFASQPNVVSWLEPHGELSQGGDDLMGTGPACDRTFRAYLQKQYASPADVARAWGMATTFANWDAIHVPELADFCGWGPGAFDLAGTWKVNFYSGAPPAPECFAPAFNDSAWLTVTAPGDDRNFTLPKQTAVYRRTFNLPAGWTAKHPRSWIYLWDSNVRYTSPPVAIYLNGKLAGQSSVQIPSIHRMSAEATGRLRPGANQLSLQLPDGYIGYRIYLSGDEPRQYPALGRGMNQKWVDLVGWRQWGRIDSVRRGMEMIREVDPNRGISLMAPSYAADGVKTLAQEYGGEFHDTGFMAALWADLLPSFMRAADLPFSVEPPGPPDNVPDFKRMMGLYQTEAINEISYFIHLGNVMWNPAIRAEFEKQLPMSRLIGKYHEPSSDVAILYSAEVGALTGFPWSNDLNANLPSGWAWCGLFYDLLDYCPRDAVTESDFGNGNAAKYKVIIDTNTSIMDQAMIDQIRKYVSGGGTFITMIQTGRHSPTQADSWPIEALTGYHVLTMEKYDANHIIIHYPDMNAPGAGSNTQQVYPAPGQSIYKQREHWMTTPWVTGLRMKKVAPDAQDLLTFADGTVVVGMRRIGKGQIIEFGAKGDSNGGTTWSWYRPIFEWLHVKTNRVAAELPDKPDARAMVDYFVNSYQSNNGLYNVTPVWNPRDAPQKITLTFRDKPVTARDVQTGAKIPLRDGRLDLTLDPLQLRMFLTPRNELAQAGAEWFDLQRKWWRATRPIGKPFPKMDQRFVRPLDDDWAWNPMADKQAPDTAPDFDDSKWPRVSVGAWTTDPDKKDVHHAEMRRRFTVPADWNTGAVRLWIATTYSDSGRSFLDGKLMQSWSSESDISGADAGGVLTPGSTHTLTLEVQGKGQLTGFVGNAWIIYVPKPAASIDLAGQWTTCKDDLYHDTGSVTLPGGYVAHSLWRTVNVPRQDAGKTVMLVEDVNRPFAAYINGTQVLYGATPSANCHLELNVTPWVHFGGDNRIQLVSVYGNGSVGRLALDMYEPGSYP